MYSQEFWNNIYSHHFHDAPWMDDSWKSNVIKTIKDDIKEIYCEELYGCRLLDYGCGNGHIGTSFLKDGMKVDLSDISSILINLLIEEYKHETDVKIHLTKSPKDLPKGVKYDIILAWNVFHHLEPEIWHQFLSEFVDVMELGGIIFISGWDNNDSIIKHDNFKAKYTQQKTWFINDLPKHIGELPISLLKEKQLIVDVPEFETKRYFRYFIFNKTNN